MKNGKWCSESKRKAVAVFGGCVTVGFCVLLFLLAAASLNIDVIGDLVYGGG